MKRLTVYLAAVIIAVVTADVVSGHFLDRYIDTHRLPGDCAAIDYTIKEADEDVIIIGNSLVLNSLMPSILSDSIGMTVYNGASNGQTLPFFRTMLDCILQRHTPRAIVLGLSDYVFTTEGVGERYNILAPYYGGRNTMIDSCMTLTPADKALMHSTFYRFNSIWWRILLYHFVNKDHSPDGFIAKPIPPQFPKLLTGYTEKPANPQRFDEFRTMLDECRKKGVTVIAVIPPCYAINKSPGRTRKQLKELIDLYDNAALIDDSADSVFLKSPQLFYDENHLNIEGAKIYSAAKGSQFRDIILNKTPSKQ